MGSECRIIIEHLDSRRRPPMKNSVILMIIMLTLTSMPVFSTDIDWTNPETINIDNAELIKQFEIDPRTYLVDGWQSYQDKKYDKAARNYLAYLYHVKNDSSNMYNLACCYGLLGKADLAAAWVTKAVVGGWTDMDHLKHDKDFDAVRETEIFKTTVAKLEAKLSENKGDPGQMLMVPAQSMVPMYVKLPEKYDAEKTYPLILGLHGYGGTATNYAQIWDRVKRTKEFIYVAMETPYGFSLGKDLGYSWFVLIDHETYPEAVARGGEMTVQNVIEALNMLKKKYKIGNVYLTGFSQGAGLTFMTGLKHPELFAGIAPFGGWLDTDIITESDLKSATALPVLIVHGKQDTMVEFKSATEAEALLKKHGYKVELFPFEGGHTVPADGLNKLQEMLQ